MKDELGGKIMTKFVELRAKTCSCLIDSPSIRHQNSTLKVRRYFIDYKRQIHMAKMTSI